MDKKNLPAQLHINVSSILTKSLFFMMTKCMSHIEYWNNTVYFIFYPPFLNGMPCFFNSLRHIVKTKASFVAYICNCMNFRLGEPIGLGHSFGQRYYQNKI